MKRLFATAVISGGMLATTISKARAATIDFLFGMRDGDGLAMIANVTLLRLLVAFGRKTAWLSSI